MKNVDLYIDGEYIKKIGQNFADKFVYRYVNRVRGHVFETMAYELEKEDDGSIRYTEIALHRVVAEELSDEDKVKADKILSDLVSNIDAGGREVVWSSFQWKDINFYRPARFGQTWYDSKIVSTFAYIASHPLATEVGGDYILLSSGAAVYFNSGHFKHDERGSALRKWFQPPLYGHQPINSTAVFFHKSRG